MTGRSKTNMLKTNLPVQVAADLMGVSTQFLRVSLQNNVVPFGWATQITASAYTYYICIERFIEYTGITFEEIEKAITEEKTNENITA